ncbi:MAG: DNA-3-methyladenine glycosylase [Bacteroidales bacterium]|jgi:DNA-3-methyladenine glycosylase
MTSQKKLRVHAEKAERPFSSKSLQREFFTRDVLQVAPEIIGMDLVVKLPGGSYGRFTIIEVEAYRGEEDMACHASKGRTGRTEVMYSEGGRLYVYFVYGMYWMLNIVTGPENDPQAVLIRSVNGHNGPGRLTRDLGISGNFYGEDLISSDRIWIEDTGIKCRYVTTPRVGIDYAGVPWTDKPWRYVLAK